MILRFTGIEYKKKGVFQYTLNICVKSVSLCFKESKTLGKVEEFNMFLPISVNVCSSRPGNAERKIC